MTLNKYQKKYYNKFIKGENIIIQAPRRSGKTYLLRCIIQNNPDKIFKIYTPNYAMYRINFSNLNNCHYYLDGKEYKNEILIGDEFIVHSIFHQSISCITDEIVIGKWENPYDTETLKEVTENKKIMSKQFWEKEFGNYLN